MARCYAARRAAAAGPMDEERAQAFWNEFSLWRRKQQLRRERSAEPWEPPAEITDPRERCFVEFDRSGRFARLGLTPQAVDGRGRQAMSARIQDDVLHKGSAATDELATKLIDTSVAYLEVEAANAGAVQEILESVSGG